MEVSAHRHVKCLWISSTLVCSYSQVTIYTLTNSVARNLELSSFFIMANSSHDFPDKNTSLVEEIPGFPQKLWTIFSVFVTRHSGMQTREGIRLRILGFGIIMFNTWRAIFFKYQNIIGFILIQFKMGKSKNKENIHRFNFIYVPFPISLMEHDPSHCQINISVSNIALCSSLFPSRVWTAAHFMLPLTICSIVQ